MASSGQRIMLSSSDNAPRLIKIENADGSSIQPSLNPQPLVQPMKPPSVTPIQANNIKRIFQTSDGQYIIIPANGGQAFIQSAIVPSTPDMGCSPKPGIATPQPITVAKVTDSSKVVFKSVPKRVTVSPEEALTSVAQTENVSLNSNTQRHMSTSMQVGDIFSAIASQVSKSLNREGESIQQYTGGGDERFVVPVSNEDVQSETVDLPASLNQPSLHLSSETIDHSSPSTSNITYIKTPQSTVRRIKVAPNILKVGSKSPTILPAGHVQLQQAAGSHGYDVFTTTQSLVSVPQTVCSTKQLTDLRLSDGSQVFIHQFEGDSGVETVRASGVGPQQYIIQDNVVPDNRPPCPVCGDKISGYHYGIFTCESCKGFFKRTVQNKKAFICHRKGECDINVLARKKCPACRFKRCLLAGMKLEAVREDRQRGGRSSYDGAQNYARARQTLGGSTPSPRRVIVNRPSPAPIKKTILLPTDNGNQFITMVYPDTSELAGGVPNDSQKPVPLQPYTPATLEDLMAVESLMSEDETEEGCCRGKFQEGDENLFMSLLHFADHCLYKIVRWARNLPDFASVSTDDQILLLQNCWGELLCLCCSWNSIHCDNEIRIATGRALNMEIATLLGIDEICERLLDFISHLRYLELDSHEFIALKTMLLLNPDVKNLRDEKVTRHNQDRVASALIVYSASHYQDKSNKFCELVSRLPELSRLSMLGKEILKTRQSHGDLPQQSLLSELLKGDNAVQT